tara:strand:- start:331 stop:444 length:114 start_codon:yes stop_codon:yes gene_type:complete
VEKIHYSDKYLSPAQRILPKAVKKKIFKNLVEKHKKK